MNYDPQTNEQAGRRSPIREEGRASQEKPQEGPLEAVAEEWRAVVGYEGRYEVSNLGRVRSLMYSTGRKNGAKSRVYPMMRSPRKSMGYPAVDLWKSGEQRSYHVHRLVAAAFMGPVPPGKEVAHLNGVRTDSRASNLTYATQSENNAHKLLHGTHLWGERHPGRKLTWEQVRKIRADRARGISLLDLASRFGVCIATISYVYRLGWKNDPGLTETTVTAPSLKRSTEPNQPALE